MLQLLGKKFGRWTVVRRSNRSEKQTYWDCLCICGVMKSVRGSALNLGQSSSCGCLNRELTSIRQKSRSIGNPARKVGTLAYFKSNTWSNLQKRTVNGRTPNEKNISYLRKGIRLDMTKEQFYEFCDDHSDQIMDLYSAGLKPSLDRINSSLHYAIPNLQILELRLNISKHFSKGKYK